MDVKCPFCKGDIITKEIDGKDKMWCESCQVWGVMCDEKIGGQCWKTPENYQSPYLKKLKEKKMQEFLKGSNT